MTGLRCICDQGRIYMDGRLWNPLCPIHGEWSPDTIIEGDPADFLKLESRQLRPLEPPSAIQLSGMSEELSEKLKAGIGEADADQIWPGDDPVPTVYDTLEVLEEAQQHYKRARQLAQDMQAAAAIKALMDGEPVEEVATACGYDLSKRAPDMYSNPVIYMEVMMGMRSPSDRSSDLSEFHGWLNDYLHRRIKGETLA